MASVRHYATGKRKNAIARVWIELGDGKMMVNQRPIERYFPRLTLRMVIEQPFEVSNQTGKYNLLAMVKGGGLTGQAGAIWPRQSAALLLARPQKVGTFKTERASHAGFACQRTGKKIYGQKGARKRFQYSKQVRPVNLLDPPGKAALAFPIFFLVSKDTSYV